MRTRVNYDVRARDAEAIAFTATSLTGTLTFSHTGFLIGLIVAVPDFTNSITVTASIADADGNEIASQAAMAKNATAMVHFDIGYCPLYGETTITFTLSGVAGLGGGDLTVTVITV